MIAWRYGTLGWRLGDDTLMVRLMVWIVGFVVNRLGASLKSDNQDRWYPMWVRYVIELHEGVPEIFCGKIQEPSSGSDIFPTEISTM